MKVIADLHLHSKYSRAVSQDMVLPIMAAWAQKKGIDLLTTGDWTHPLWFREIRRQLVEVREGVYRVKGEGERRKGPVFLLTTEVASIYSQGGRLRRIHNLILVPSFETAEKINKELVRRGANLMADGRPMMGITSPDLLELILEIDKRSLLIPCHAWTPWFSLYGSMSGFDSIEECFGDYAKYIYAVETGLSSSPEMNWRIKELDNRSIISCSDAHSGAKLGREATVFEVEDIKKLRYEDIRRAIVGEKWVVSREVSNGGEDKFTHNSSSQLNPQLTTHPHISFTIEFYPEEGKYHYTGHRNCNVVQSPEQTKTNGSLCPVCHRQLTVGVMHRVEQLADKSAKLKAQSTKLDNFGVRWIVHENNSRPPYVMLVSLLEILAEALSSTTTSSKVKEAYEQLIGNFGSEIAVFLQTEVSEIEKAAGSRIAQGIKKVRKGDIFIRPGFDGEYGKVKIWGENESNEVEEVQKKVQLGLF